MANYTISSFDLDGSNNYVMSVPYGVCGTAAGTAAKTVNVGNFALETGAIVAVKFTNGNTSTASITLNVSSTGAKTLPTKELQAGATYQFMYNGSSWDLVGSSASSWKATTNTSKAYVVGTTKGTDAVYNTSVYTEGSVLYGAAWNDYAEYRQATGSFEPGRVVCENGDDTLSLATERLQPGANIVSDTFGFAIGRIFDNDVPVAVCGRVLAYPYEDRESYKPGDPVCAGPDGTVSKMSREEVCSYPDRIIGTVSAIPNYEAWGTTRVPVNGRIWIKVR